jgi:phosphoribosyl-ATP pyrophosphohydrolase/phosphoribosyl-AMP cyclohydrolase
VLVTKENFADLAWQKMNNLIPAIIQHAATGAVLMQGFMNQEALNATLTSGRATFYSRSKQALWLKGETSDNFLNVRQILTDCDKDSLLIACIPMGPTCHLGTESCFPEQKLSQQKFLTQLEQVIEYKKTRKCRRELHRLFIFERYHQNRSKSW